MKFFKSLIKKDPEEAAKQKILELELPDHAINLTEAIEFEDFSLVVNVAEELISDKKLKGELIGKKGWFLPDFQSKLEEKWEKLEKGSVNLSKLSDAWKLNEKRVYIALEKFGRQKNLSDPIFVRNEMQIFLNSYLKKLWIDSLATFEEDVSIEFDEAIEKVRAPKETKEILREEVLKWVEEPNSAYILGSDNIVRPIRSLKEYVEDYVNNQFDEGSVEVTYEQIASALGTTRKAVGKQLQVLVDEKAFNEVTLYPIDEKLVKRDAL